MLTVAGLFTALAGVLLGIIWGALPGLSVNMAMVLLVGMTYSLPPQIAIIFLIGIWVGAEFGGAIPAILINIPGTPAAVPTQMAGYPLAQRGEGGAAIGAAIMFSMIGNWAGLAVLVTLAPLMIIIALDFGSWEMFLVAMFGVVISGTLTGKEQAIKGWAMGWFGLLLSMVGTDLIHGVERWSFGVNELRGGIQYLPVMIGLFGLTEALNALTNKRQAPAATKLKRFKPSIRLMRRYWRSALRSSVVGTVVGAIPGAGANIAAYVSYTIGERATGKKFSDGDVEGVVCSEVANNANIGGSLLPATTLAIPGNSSSAIILAALALHGITLGPTVNEDHPGFLPFLFACLLSSNIFMYCLALGAVRPSVKILTLPTGVIMPVVILFALVGAFSVSFSEFDVGVMFLTGLTGYALLRHGYPFAPLILGLILGPIVDENLRRTILIYQGSYEQLLYRPIGDLLIVAIACSFYLGMRRRANP